VEEGGNTTTTVYTHEIGVYEPNYNPGNRTGKYQSHSYLTNIFGERKRENSW
jgi:hypothetical protein